MISNAEVIETAPAPATEEPKATKRARRGAHRAHRSPAKARSAKKATPPKKGPKPRKSASRTRESTKTATVLELLKRPGGATAKDLMKATGWQPHSVRGFLSGTVGKKMKLAVASSKKEDGERTYSVKS